MSVAKFHFKFMAWFPKGLRGVALLFAGMGLWYYVARLFLKLWKLLLDEPLRFTQLWLWLLFIVTNMLVYLLLFPREPDPDWEKIAATADKTTKTRDEPKS